MWRGREKAKIFGHTGSWRDVIMVERGRKVCWFRFPAEGRSKVLELRSLGGGGGGGKSKTQQWGKKLGREKKAAHENGAADGGIG